MLAHLLACIFYCICLAKDPQYVRHYSAWIEGQVFYALALPWRIR